MANPTNGYPRAAEITPRLRIADQLDSTNATLLAESAADPDTHPHLSVVVTRDQQAGRGRQGRTWTAPPGTGLAVSVLLRTEAIATEHRGWIPLVAGSAVVHAVSAQLGRRIVSLKWPNDVLVDGAKISGILTEVSSADPYVVVVGAGINTDLPKVLLPVPGATSFRILGVDADEDTLLADFLTALRDGIAALAVGGPDAVRASVLEHTGTIGKTVTVSLPGGDSLTGVAQDLDESGRLVIDQDGTAVVVAAGDVEHLR